MKSKNELPFEIGDIVRIKPGTESYAVNDHFDGEAIFQGNSEVSAGAGRPNYALERLDGMSGGAQNGWWNFRASGVAHLELVKAVKPKVIEKSEDDFENLDANL